MALFPPEPSSFSGPEARFLRQPPLPALSRVYTRLPASTPLTWPSCLGPGSPDLALSPPCSEKQRKREILEQTDMCDQDIGGRDNRLQLPMGLKPRPQKKGTFYFLFETMAAVA